MTPIKQTIYLSVNGKEHSNYHIFDLHECEGAYLETVAESYGYFFTPEQLNEYIQKVIKYTLRMAADNVWADVESFDWNSYEAVVDKDSILNLFAKIANEFEV